MIKSFNNKARSFKKFLKSGKHVPHWLILCFDMFIVLATFSIGYTLISVMWLEMFNLFQFAKYLAVFLVIAFFVERLFNLHTSLLRYSNIHDLVKVMLTYSVVGMLFTVTFLSLEDHSTFGRTIEIVFLGLYSFLASTFSLITFRMVAKFIYYRLEQSYSSRDTRNVLIFGADHDSVLLKQALENNDQIRYIVRGFIDVTRQRTGSIIEQKRVFHFRDLALLKSSKKIDELIIIREHLEERAKKVVVEHCIQKGIKVKTVPPVNEWIQGKFNPKQLQQLKIEDLLQRKPIKINSETVSADLHGKRVLVTGAAGSIGSELVRQIMKFEPGLMILLDQAESPLHELQLELEENFPHAPIVPFVGSVTNVSRMETLFRQYTPQMVYHAAAYKHVPLMENNPFEAINVNVGGAKVIADLSVQYQIEKFVMISTDKAVNPTNVMGASKLLAETYIQSYGPEHRNYTKFITTRFGNVLGSNGSVIPRFRAQIEKGGPITVTHPDIIRYFMTISEATQLVLEAGTMGNGGEIFVFDMGKPVKIVDLAKRMIQLSNLGPNEKIDIVYTGLRPGEKLYEELLADEETTLPTHHEKISIAKVRIHDFFQVKQMIDELLKINGQQDKMLLVKKMKQIAPEFISENSIFSTLDNHEESLLSDEKNMEF